jgi:PEP-CTERM motif
LSVNRFLLSLVAALFLATLASADSTNVAAAILHSTGAHNPSNTSAGHSSINVARDTPTIFVKYNNDISPDRTGDVRIGVMLSRTAMDSIGGTDSQAGRISFPDRKYGPTCCTARQGIGTGLSHALSTPEPNSLMLLSTGLMGIAGVVRRKLFRG